MVLETLAFVPDMKTARTRRAVFSGVRRMAQLALCLLECHLLQWMAPRKAALKPSQRCSKRKSMAVSCPIE